MANTDKRKAANAAIFEARIAARNHYAAFFALANTATALERLARKADESEERLASTVTALDGLRRNGIDKATP